MPAQLPKITAFVAHTPVGPISVSVGNRISFPVGKRVEVRPTVVTQSWIDPKTRERFEREIEEDVAAICRQYVPSHLTEVGMGPATVQATPRSAPPANPAGPGPVPNPLDVPPTDDDGPNDGDGLDALSAADLVELAEIREVTSEGGPDSLSLDDLKERVEKAEIKADRRSTEKMLAALEAAGHDLNKAPLIDALRQVGAKASELTE